MSDLNIKMISKLGMMMKSQKKVEIFRLVSHSLLTVDIMFNENHSNVGIEVSDEGYPFANQKVLIAMLT